MLLFWLCFYLFCVFIWRAAQYRLLCSCRGLLWPDGGDAVLNVLFFLFLSYWEDSEGGEVPPDDHVTTVPFFFTKSWGFHREVFRCWERTANPVLIASSYFTLYSVKLSYCHIFHDTQRPPSNTSCRKTQTPNAPTSPETTFRSKPDQFDLHLKLVLLKTWKKKIKTT